MIWQFSNISGLIFGSLDNEGHTIVGPILGPLFTESPICHSGRE